MQALILAAGFGIRLREIIHGRPKHLAPINGQPFLRYLIRLLNKNGIDQCVISIGYLAQYIIDEFKFNTEGVKLIFSEDDRPLGTAGSLKAAQKYFSSNFFVINGDTYLDINYSDLYKAHIDNHKIATIVINQDLVSCGVYVFSPKIFSLISDKEKSSLEKDIFPKLKQKNQLNFFSTTRQFIDIGTPAGYQKALTILK